MDALEFLSEAKRMCDQHTEPCDTCAANEFCGFTPEFPSEFGKTTQMQKMVELAVDDLICSYGPCVDCPVSPDFWCANGRRREDAHAQD